MANWGVGGGFDPINHCYTPRSPRLSAGSPRTQRKSVLSVGGSAMVSPRDLSPAAGANEFGGNFIGGAAASVLSKNELNIWDKGARKKTTSVSPKRRESPEAAMKRRLAEESSHYYRPVHKQPNHSGVFDVHGQMATPDAERYDRDYVAQQHREKEAKHAEAEAHRATRYAAKVAYEQKRWEEENEAFQRQRRHDSRLKTGTNGVVYGNRSSEGSVPYDPINQQVRDSLDGLRYQYEEDVVKYRTALRGDYLYSRNNTGFNPITGQEMMGVTLPALPLSPEEVSAERMAQLEGVAVSSLKRKMLEWSGRNAIHNFAIRFSEYTTGGGRRLTLREVKEAVEAFHVTLSSQELMTLFQHFDTEGTGHVNFTSLLFALMGHLNSRRLDIITRVFQKADPAGAGCVALDDLARHYDASRDPLVLARKLTAEEVVLEFRAQFVGRDTSAITFEQFKFYCHCVSTGFDDDAEFDAFMTNTWHVRGAGAVNKRRGLCTHHDGRQTVEIVQMDDPVLWEFQGGACPYKIHAFLMESRGIQVTRIDWV